MTIEEQVGHYAIGELRDMEQLRSLFPDGRADALNWCVLSTSGIHGSYLTLDDAGQYFSGNLDTDEHWLDDDLPSDVFEITALVVNPRLVRLLYGNIHIRQSDVPWLRELVRGSLVAMVGSQAGNI